MMVKSEPIEILEEIGDTRSTAFAHCWLLIREIHKHLDSVLYKNEHLRHRYFMRRYVCGHNP